MSFFHRESLIERLARESHWMISQREGDYYRVRDMGVTPILYVHVRCRDDCDSVRFWMIFQVRFPLASVTQELLMGLLVRNRNVLFGRWCVAVADSCEVLLNLQYTAIKAGLTAATFDAICREMIEEHIAVYQLLSDQLANNLRVQPSPGLPAMSRSGNSDGQKAISDQGIVWLGD